MPLSVNATPPPRWSIWTASDNAQRYLLEGERPARYSSTRDPQIADPPAPKIKMVTFVIERTRLHDGHVHSIASARKFLLLNFDVYGPCIVTSSLRTVWTMTP
jgi:hypothetical protein